MKLYALITSLLMATSALATTFNSDGSPSNIQTLHSQAQDGDTITLPTGTFTWTTGIVITKRITIKGNTTTNAPTNGTCTDNTVVIDNLSNRSVDLIRLNTGDQRVTGITFRGTGSIQTNIPSVINTTCATDPGGHPNRVDHCHFDHPFAFPSVIIMWNNFGVIDHNAFTGYGTNGQTQVGACHAFFPNYHGSTLADGIWQVPAGMGGPEFVFLEDNYMDSGGTFALGTNLFGGGKICMRHCNYHNSTGTPATHGLARNNESQRGGRALEIYNNTWDWAAAFVSWDGTDGATMYMHDNTFTRNKAFGLQLNYYRGFASFGSTFGGCTGANAWDYNVTESNGTHVDGHPPYQFEHGALTAVTNGLNFTVNGAHQPWTTDQWVGYNVRKAGDNTFHGWIEHNGTNTIQVYGWGVNLPWTVGMNYEIYRAIKCMDQPGYGTSPSINRASPAWPNQAHEPSYQWNNVNAIDGSHFAWAPAPPKHFTANVDYFDEVVPSGYVPYTYPHPIVSGSPSPTPTVTPSATATSTPTPTATSTPTPTPTATPDVCSSNIRAYYKLEDLTDFSGNGNTLTNNNGVTFVPGKINNAANFVAASSQSLSHADNAAYQMGTSTNFTMSAWIKTGTLGATNYFPVSYGETPTAGYRFLFDTGNNIVRCQIRDGTNTAESSTGITTAYFDGNWHLFVMTVDRGGNITLYVDNVAQTPAATSGVTGSLNDTQSVGFRIAATGAFFDGGVDEVRLYDKVLNGTEIAGIWNGGAGTTCVSPSPTPTPTPTVTPTITPTATPTPAGPPSAPTGLQVIPTKTLQWTSNPGNEGVTTYKVYRTKHGGADLVDTVVNPLSAVSSFLNAKQTRFYVTAVNDNGEGPKSSNITIRQ